jgi:hypothetical protein
MRLLAGKSQGFIPAKITTKINSKVTPVKSICNAPVARAF